MNKDDNIAYEVKGDIGILIIQNGSKNVIDEPCFLDVEYLEDWIISNSLKGVVITGKGRHFSVGANVDNIRQNRDTIEYLEKSLNKGKEILAYIEQLNIITVAAISGICFGAGFELALACQHRICTENALFAFPESNLGMMPGLAGNLRLAQLIGKAAASEIIISGRSVTAEEALEKNIVSHIVPNKCHLEEACRFIEEMTANKTVKQINNVLAVMNQGAFDFKEGEKLESKLFEEMARNI